VLKEKATQHSHVIAMLQDKVAQLCTDYKGLFDEVSALRSASAGIEPLSENASGLKRQIAQKLNNLDVEQLSTDLNELRKSVLALKMQITAISPNVIRSQNQSPSPSPPLTSIDSRIISGFPEMFPEF
jgi:outer membrane murein-binding lipoprotein Lpp